MSFMKVAKEVAQRAAKTTMGRACVWGPLGLVISASLSACYVGPVQEVPMDSRYYNGGSEVDYQEVWIYDGYGYRDGRDHRRHRDYDRRDYHRDDRRDRDYDTKPSHRDHRGNGHNGGRDDHGRDRPPQPPAPAHQPPPHMERPPAAHQRPVQLEDARRPERPNQEEQGQKRGLFGRPYPSPEGDGSRR